MFPEAIDRRRVLAGALSLAGAARGQRASNLDPKALQEDARILRRSWEALHPGLHRYNTPADLDALFAGVQRASPGRRA